MLASPQSISPRCACQAGQAFLFVSAGTCTVRTGRTSASTVESLSSARRTSRNTSGSTQVRHKGAWGASERGGVHPHRCVTERGASTWVRHREGWGGVHPHGCITGRRGEVHPHRCVTGVGCVHTGASLGRVHPHGCVTGGGWGASTQVHHRKG